MPEHIPWEAVRDFAEQHGCTQMILMAFDGALTHVVTWGKSPTESLQAAKGGNLMKEVLGFPPAAIHEEPQWLKDLRQEFALLKIKAEAMHVVLTVVSVKADLTDEVLIDALERAEAAIRAGRSAAEVLGTCDVPAKANEAGAADREPGPFLPHRAP